MPRLFEFCDLLIECLDATLRKCARARPIRSGVQLQKFFDFPEGEPRRLRLFDKAQPPNIVRAIAANAAGARGFSSKRFR